MPMRAQALRSRPRRRSPPKDDGQRSAIAPNTLGREFHAERPNQRWIADFTYILTAEGWLYVAAVIDLLSRRVVGWSMKAEMTAQLVTDALMMAIWRRGKPVALLHHSDQGKLDEAIMQKIDATIRKSLLTKWKVVDRGFWTHGVGNLRDYFVSAELFTMTRRAETISCPRLITQAEMGNRSLHNRCVLDWLDAQCGFGL
ncbi:hypothetical protein CHELA1G11_20915 [Hyphomicrobiales bacterium]|nr:hypothetical protein CHELA1G11_20915 [Hyphomicrobiales bacterium]CAH1692571.1 hypothetical protein CHELA1G2_21231 [Hyphomicrobiales bacterium]